MKKPKSASAQKVSPVLKCRKGDLAIRLDKRFPSQIVEVAEYRPTVKWPSGFAMFDVWKVLHPTYEAGYSYFCEDKYLLPIPPDDLEETETEEFVCEKEGEQ
ncbi:hypothetical protein C8R21_11475 [Nitrosospira multiformis]|uniref:Uncharacterized protein n=1 Tax=Nitrosospira multiformis TaxID=1231 RepID=A0A2T5IA86_9PROT|nr:hypothetical protein [Nitrosospira multiformis]PTQ80728.1 hypothetical protein C8R21_11475 [Nitrosospira multiformis]